MMLGSYLVRIILKKKWMTNWNIMHIAMYKNSLKTSRECIMSLRSEGSQITYKSQNNWVQTPKCKFPVFQSCRDCFIFKGKLNPKSLFDRKWTWQCILSVVYMSFPLWQETWQSWSHQRILNLVQMWRNTQFKLNQTFISHPHVRFWYSALCFVLTQAPGLCW